jgi:hypothetical protein
VIPSLSKGVLLQGIQSRGEVLDSPGFIKLEEFVVDKFPSVVGDHQDEFVSSGSFGLGKEGFEDLVGV